MQGRRLAPRLNALWVNELYDRDNTEQAGVLERRWR